MPQKVADAKCCGLYYILTKAGIVFFEKLVDQFVKLGAKMEEESSRGNKTATSLNLPTVIKITLQRESSLSIGVPALDTPGQYVGEYNRKVKEILGIVDRQYYLDRAYMIGPDPAAVAQLFYNAAQIIGGSAMEEIMKVEQDSRAAKEEITRESLQKIRVIIEKRRQALKVE